MVSYRPPVAQPSERVLELWTRWFEHRAKVDRDALVAAYMGFTRILAAKCYSRRITQGLEFEDYLQYGVLGLLESIDRFEASAGAKFETFAGYRIQGAILNGVESLSEVQKQVSVRSQVLRSRTASLATGAQGAQGATTLETLARTAIGLAVGFALEDACMFLSAQDGEPFMLDNAYSALEFAQGRQGLIESVNGLCQQERSVIHWHYFQEMPFSEIASTMGLTKGRISQIHSAALRHLAELHRPRT